MPGEGWRDACRRDGKGRGGEGRGGGRSKKHLRRELLDEHQPRRAVVLKLDAVRRDEVVLLHPDRARAWTVNRGETREFGTAWLLGHGPSVEPEEMGRFSRVQRAARSLQMQPGEHE